MIARGRTASVAPSPLTQPPSCPGGAAGPAGVDCGIDQPHMTQTHSSPTLSPRTHSSPRGASTKARRRPTSRFLHRLCFSEALPPPSHTHAHNTTGIYDGTSQTNFKICTDSTCSFMPSLPKTSLDHCDPGLVALNSGDETDTRASTYCEYKVCVCVGGEGPCCRVLACFSATPLHAIRAVLPSLSACSTGHACKACSIFPLISARHRRGPLPINRTGAG